MTIYIQPEPGFYNLPNSPEHLPNGTGLEMSK